MAGNRECLFCGRSGHAKMTREHAWPNWLLTVFPHNDEKHTVVRNSTAGERQEWECVGQTPVTVKRVCANCNSGWMSELENRCKPILESLIPGVRQLTVSISEQNTLSRWCLKTFMMFDASCGNSRTFFRPQDRLRVKNDERLNFPFHIYVAAYVGSRYDMRTDYSRRLRPFEHTGHRNVVYEGDVYHSTLVLGRLVCQLDATRVAVDHSTTFVTFMSQFWKETIRPITAPPPLSEFDWPFQHSLDDKSLLVFRNRFEMEESGVRERIERGISLDERIKPSESGPRDKEMLEAIRWALEAAKDPRYIRPAKR
jgi:hypothetical protein